MVEFVVRVPEILPEQRVFLAGDGPALGEWCAHGVPLERGEDDTHRASLNVPLGFRGQFLATLGRWREVENDGQGHELPPRKLHVTGTQTVEVNVAGWGRNAHNYHPDFASRFLPHARTISVWLPPGYDLDSARRFPVLYMQDGQNLFDPETAFAGNPWWADEATEREVRAGRVRPVIIVGVANTVDRLREYGPRQPGLDQEEDLSRDYGRFVVEEVKPLIDGLTHYRHLTRQSAADELFRLGDGVLPHLRKAAAAADGEAKTRLTAFVDGWAARTGLDELRLRRCATVLRIVDAPEGRELLARIEKVLP